MRLFSLSSSRGDKSSKRKSTSTSTSSKRSSSQSFASTPVLQAPIVASESRWNAAGQQITPSHAASPPRPRNQPDNKSTTNLSSTSTLLDAPLPPSCPPPAPNSYEEFVARAQAAEARERQMAYAWQKAEERRRENCKSLASDPWRGGFGPVSSGRRERRDGGGKGMGLSPKREGVRGWLSGNGLVGR